MGSGGLRNFRFGSRPPEAVRERAEPRLVASNAPAMSRRPAEVKSGTPTNLRSDGPRLGVAPAVSAADRQPVSSGERETKSRRYGVFTAIAALAIGAIGAIAGTGLLSSAPSEKKPIVTAGPPDDTNPSGADHSAAAIPAQARTPRPVAAAAIAGSPGEQPKQKASASKAPLDLSKSALPAAAAKPAPPLAVASPPENKPVQLVKSTPVPEIAPSLAPARKQPEPEAAAAGRPAHGQVAARHTHSRSARETRPVNSATIPEHASTARHPQRATRAAETSALPAGPDRALAARHSQRTPSAGESSAETAAPQPAGQTAEFDQLLAHLTGSAKPASEPRAATPAKPAAPAPPSRSASGDALTPPEPGAPDPFALRAPNTPSAQ